MTLRDRPAPARSRPIAGPAGAAVILAVLFAAICIVDPLREFMSQDDGWAYARSVEGLLATGRYTLDAWSAANMPVQIYLAGAAAELAGYSIGLLRFTTLGLLCAGLLSFHAMLRDLGVRAGVACALALALLANPLVLMLGFTFMSDVQFMGWLLLALFLYVRGFRRERDALVLLGAVAGGCAIGTRQFGIAIVVGLVGAYLFAGAARRPPARRLLIALSVPLAASLWQLRAGLGAPNFTQAVRLHEQAYFLSLGPAFLLHETAWRIATVGRYLGMSMLAALPLLAALALRSRGTPAASPAQRRRRRFAAGAAIVVCVFLLAYARISPPFSGRDGGNRLLPLWWMLPNAFWSHVTLMRLAEGAGLLIAGLWAWVLLANLSAVARLKSLRFESWLLAAIGLSLLGLHLAYVQLNDTYLVGLLPFALLGVALVSKDRPPPARWLAASAGASLAIVGALSFWMRGDYNLQQAQWQAADSALAAGTPARCIGGTRHWNEYHGAFDDWLAQTYPAFDGTRGAVSPARPGPLHPPFYAWMQERDYRADYRVSAIEGQADQPGWRVHREFPYRDALGRQRTATLLAREPDPATPRCHP